MSTGPRGLAPRGPWRVGRVTGPDGASAAVVVDDDGVRTAVAERPARVAQWVARHGRADAAELVAEFDVPADDVPGFAADLADLLRADVLVRAGSGPRCPVRVEPVGAADVGELRRALEGCELLGERELVVLCCDDHAVPGLHDELERRSRDADVLVVRWGGGRCWIGPFVRRGTGHRNSGSCPDCLLEALRRNLNGDAPAEFSAIGAGPALARASVGAVLGVLDGLVSAPVGPWGDRLREIDLRTLDVVDHPVPPCRAQVRELASPGFVGDHVSARTGVMAPLVVRRTVSGRYLAVTSHPVRSRSRGGSWRRATAFGFGTTAEQASISCRGEAVERFSTSWRPTPEAVVAAADDLRGQGSRVDGVHDGRPVEFRPLRNPLDGSTLDWWVPAAAVTFGHPEPAGSRPDSSGCAAGRDVRDAVRRGLAELLERDAVAAWWYGRELRPEVDEELLPDARTYAAELAAHGRRGWFLDLTGRLGIPVVAAVATRWDGTGTTLGFGAASTLAGAAHRAAGELLQVLGCLEFGDDLGVHLPPEWDRERVEDHPYLLPHGRTRAQGGQTATEALSGWIERLSRAGVDVGYLDLTHPRVGVPVVRVVAPGLSSWYRRSRPPVAGQNPFDLPV